MKNFFCYGKGTKIISNSAALFLSRCWGKQTSRPSSVPSPEGTGWFCLSPAKAGKQLYVDDWTVPELLQLLKISLFVKRNGSITPLHDASGQHNGGNVGQLLHWFTTCSKEVVNVSYVVWLGRVGWPWTVTTCQSNHDTISIMDLDEASISKDANLMSPLVMKRSWQPSKRLVASGRRCKTRWAVYSSSDSTFLP